jgi:hypothetical protein
VLNPTLVLRATRDHQTRIVPQLFRQRLTHQLKRLSWRVTHGRQTHQRFQTQRAVVGREVSADHHTTGPQQLLVRVQDLVRSDHARVDGRRAGNDDSIEDRVWKRVLEVQFPVHANRDVFLPIVQSKIHAAKEPGRGAVGMRRDLAEYSPCGVTLEPFPVEFFRDECRSE